MSHSDKFVQLTSASTTTTIYDLNDYVLRDIFDHFDDIDLCKIADVCSTFRRNAQATFSVHYKFVEYSFNSENNEEYDCDTKKIDLHHLHSILRNFGQSIYSLGISLDDAVHNHSQKVMESIIQYCGETLDELSLRNVRFTDDLIQKMQPLLAQLQELNVKLCSWQSIETLSAMLTNCPELQTLLLDTPQNFDDENLDFPVRCTIPSLKSIRLEQCDAFKKKSLMKFFKFNPQLKEITFIGLEKITSRIIPSIVQYVPHIEKMTYMHNIFSTDFFENVKHLKHLTSLKSLEIDFDLKSIASFVNELAETDIPLKRLSLWNFRADNELVHALSKFKKVKFLSLIGPCDFMAYELEEILMNMPELIELSTGIKRTTDLVKIIRFKPKLREFRMCPDRYYMFTLDIDLYMMILDAVLKRKEMCPLVLIIHSDGQYNCVKVSEKVLKSNQNLLKIIVVYG